MTDGLRIGVLGAANIARSFISGVKPSGTVVVAAVASRSADKAAKFASETGVPRFHGSYEALLADPEIDAIYNPLPNSLHAEWSIRACEAGKHVLCEKPLCTSADEARAMFAAARKNRVHLVEGYPYRAQPQTIAALELIHAGAIGPLQLIQSSFGFTLSAGPNIRGSSELAGGSLMDAGTYPVSLILMAARERPARVSAVAHWQDGVDHALAATLEFKSGLLAQVTSSFSTSVHRFALIAGTQGVIQTQFLNHLPADRPAEFLIKRGVGADKAFEKVETAGTNGFRAEAESFERLIRGTGTDARWEGPTPEESIGIAATLEAILHSARAARPVNL
jgi:D-xylose 1-dehydrogenase (NADP+, D-xylono-1,5-lactone-forming)